MISGYKHVVCLVEKIIGDEVSKVEKELNKLVSENGEVLMYLHEMLKDSQITDSSKHAAALYINAALADNVPNLPVEQVAKFLMSFLSDLAVFSIFKRCLERAIITIIEKLEIEPLIEFREFTYKLTKDEMLRDTGCLLIACFACAEIDCSHLLYLTQVCFELTLNNIFTDTAQSLNHAKQYNQIIKTWIKVLNELIKLENVQPETSKIIYEIINSQSLTYAMFSLYKWFAAPDLFICSHENVLELNVLKGQVSELQAIAVQYICKKDYTTQMFKFSMENLNQMVKNVCIMATNPSAIEGWNCQDLMLNFIKIIRFLYARSPQLFSLTWRNILHSMVFPLLAFSDNELYQFEETPENFVTFIQDCCEKQKFGVLKSQICSLLEKMGDFSQEMDPKTSCIDYIFSFAVDSIKNKVNLPRSSQWGFPFVNAQIAFLILGIFSYRIEYHKKELEQLKQIFINKELRNFLLPLEASLAYLFLSYNYSDLFVNPALGEHWIGLALEESNHPTVTHSALDFLTNAANQYDFHPFYEKIIEKITVNRQGLFWDLLFKLLEKNHEKMNEQMMINLVNQCFQRIKIQLNLLGTQQETTTIFMVKMIQVLQTIVGFDQYCEGKPELYRTVWGITSGFETFYQHRVQDQVLKIVGIFLKKSAEIGQQLSNFLPVLLKCFEEQKYQDAEYVYVLNRYILKPNSDRLTGVLVTLKTAVMSFVFSQDDKLKCKVAIGNILIMLQNYLAIHGYSLQENQFYEISSIAMRLLPSEETEYEKVLVARSLNLILLCSMHLKKEPIEGGIACIRRFYKQKVYFNYDIKVLAGCFRRQVFLETEPGVIAEMLTILSHAVQYYQNRIKQEKAAIKLRKKYNSNKVRHVSYKKYKTFEVVLKHIETPFNNIDSFETVMNDILNKLRNDNYQLYSQTISQIDAETNQILSRMCRQTKLANGEKRVIMRIKGIKKIEQEQPEEAMIKEFEKKNKQENQELLDEEDQEDEQSGFKRARVVEKKKGKKKNRHTEMI